MYLWKYIILSFTITLIPPISILPQKSRLYTYNEISIPPASLYNYINCSIPILENIYSATIRLHWLNIILYIYIYRCTTLFDDF